MAVEYKSAYQPMVSDPASRAASAESAYDESRRRYDEEANRTYSQRNEATTRANTARAAADGAMESYKAGGGRTALSTWKPETYAPVSQVSQWMAAAPMRGGAPAGGGGSRSAMRMAAPAAGGGGSELAAFDTSALDAFDPTAAGTTFAKGAYGDFKRGLDKELNSLRDVSVARGRFDTGLYDVDQGDVVTELGGMFEDKIAQVAPTFSGQRLSAISDSARLRLDRASGMDTNSRLNRELDMTFADREAARAEEARMAADELGLGYSREETTRMGLGLDAARAADDLDFRRTSDTNRLTFDRDSRLADIDERRSSTGLDAALGRERTYLGEARDARGEATSAASSQRDWAARDRELEELRAEIAAIRNQKNGIGPGGERYAGSLATPMEDAKARFAVKQGYTYSA